MEMAENFPHVLFTGVDIGGHFSHCLISDSSQTKKITVPIATRYPLPNVTFEVGDIIEEFRWSDSAFDFVHARDIALSVSRRFASECKSLTGHKFFSGIGT